MTKAGDEKPPAANPWALGTFEGAELATLRRAAALSFAEKVTWLEEAQRISLLFQEQRRREGLPSIFPDGHIER